MATATRHSGTTRSGANALACRALSVRVVNHSDARIAMGRDRRAQSERNIAYQFPVEHSRPF